MNVYANLLFVCHMCNYMACMSSPWSRSVPSRCKMPGTLYAHVCQQDPQRHQRCGECSYSALEQMLLRQSTPTASGRCTRG